MDPSEEIIDEYFEYLADRDVYRAPTVLSWLTDYIDTKNENAIYKLLQHSLASEAVAGLVDLLEFDDKRLTESVVHILGTIVEHPRCRQYVLEVPRNTATSGQTNPTLFTALVNMLMSDDKNVVMNAAGTIANIAESSDGRLWILQQAVFDDALPILGVLTVDPHQWAASNSALVLARLTLSQEGIVKILTHERCSYVLINLSTALCGHNPGSSMNAAFAVGRLLEREDARSKLLAMKNFKNTMTALTKMLYNKEAGPRKNACFAFSCLANSKEGHDRLLSNVNSELILDQLVRLITDPDDETAWFAAVTLRSVGSQKEGVFRLRDHKSVHSVLKKLVKGGGVTLKSDLLTEVKMTLDILGKLPKLPAPVMNTIDSFSVSARWDSVIATVGNKVSYQFFQGCTCVYEGTKTSTTVKNLKPFTSYVFRIRAVNATDEGPYSGPALITTNEGVPGPPGEVHNEGKPQHNSIKISWTPPPNPNGTLTGYNIYSDGKRVGVVGIDKLSYVVKDLPHSTSIPIQVAPVTAAGEGEKSVPIMCSTLNLSDYPPKKPILSTSGGANEINVSWIDPPKQLGPIDHYELVMNGEVIYSGKEQGYRVSNLEPLTNYTFNVRVVTADKYVIESEPAKKKAGSKDDEGISREEKEELLAERDAMQARLKAELARLKALEAALKEEEHLRRLEVDHKLTLGSRGGPAYNLDDPDVAGCLSGSLLAKLKAAGITDISMLEEKDILALGLNEEELNQLLDAIYMAKYLKASPRLAKFLKDTGYNPLELWKLNYQDVNKMALPETLKKELFGHVLGQQTSFVANLEIPTSRNIILKGWKDENLAFTARHDAKLVTKNFHAKEELTDYIDKLRAVVQKNGGGASGTESEGELPEPEKNRTPTPEVAKPVSETREIIRPKKKSDRFTTNKKQTSNDDKKSTLPRKPAPEDNTKKGLATIEEVSSAITLDTSPPSSAAPMGISEVVVTKTKVPPNTSESSLSSVQQSTSSIKPGEKPDPRSLAAKSLSALVPPSKSVTFDDNVRVNTAETGSLINPEETQSVYVPNVVTARVKSFDPEIVAETSDTAISLDNDNHKDSVNFLVDYVTSYKAKPEGGEAVVTSSSQNECDVKPDENLSQYFASKTYNHALSNLEDSVQEDSGLAAQEHVSQLAVPGTENSEEAKTEWKSLDADSKSSDTTSYTSFSSESNQKIGLTSLSSLGSIDTTSQSESTTSLNAKTTQDNDLPSSPHKNNTVLDPSSHDKPTHGPPVVTSHDSPPQTSDPNLATSLPGQEAIDHKIKNQPLQKHASQIQFSLDCIPEHLGPQTQRLANQAYQDQPPEKEAPQNIPQKVVAEGLIPQVQLSFDNVNLPKGPVPQKPAHKDANSRKSHGRTTSKQNEPQDHTYKDRPRRPRHDSDETNPIRSLNDILLFDSEHRNSTSNEMTAEENDHTQSQAHNYKHDYKSHRKRFNIDDERKKDDGVDEQNKLITALIAQQNNDFEVQNKRTKQLISTVRNNIKNAIQSNRDVGPNRQLSSSNKFISAVNQTRRHIKLSNVNMFGEMTDFPSHQRPVANVQVKTSPPQGRRRQRRKKQQQQTLSPVNRQGPATAELQFHFPKL